MILEIYYFCCRPSLPVWRGCASPPPSCRGKPTFCESTNIGGGGYRGATNIGVFCTFFLWVDIYQTWLRLRAAKDRERQLTPVPKISVLALVEICSCPTASSKSKISDIKENETNHCEQGRRLFSSTCSAAALLLLLLDMRHPGCCFWLSLFTFPTLKKNQTDVHEN